jgi:hypothetical protein
LKLETKGYVLASNIKINKIFVLEKGGIRGNLGEGIL